MKIIAVEEHFAAPEIMAERQSLAPDVRDLAVKMSATGDIARRLDDTADERIRLYKSSRTLETSRITGINDFAGH